MNHAPVAIEEKIRCQFEEGRPSYISSDPAMHKIFARIAKLAKLPPRTNILITGETGVGKEVLAQLLHDMSKRTKERFVIVNCAALPETMFERELLGYDKGAFTGATSDKPGLFEQAHGGTILLDEIGEIPLHLQAKLLRVVEERKIRRLGSTMTRPISVQIIAATNVNLEEAVKEGRFRQDLYYRICGTTLHVPPLRARFADIPLLAARLLQEESSALEWPIPLRLAPETIACLQTYSYPGNVRELRKILSEAILESDDEWILPEHLPEHLRTIVKKPGPKLHDAATLKRLVEYERIRWALEQTAGNQTRAAQLLAMPLRTFVSRLGRHRFKRPKKSAEHTHRPAA